MPSVTASGQRRAVAELDATIGRVEEQRREQLAAAARLAAAGRDPAPLRAPGLPAPELGHFAPGVAAGGAPPRRGTRGGGGQGGPDRSQPRLAK
jgi:hypothetical protein